MSNAKAKLSLVVLPFLLLSALFFLTGCSAGAEIVGIHMTNPETMKVYYGNFSYEGIGVSVDFRDGTSKEIALTEDMVSEVERLKFFKMGEQEIEVVYRKRFKTVMPVEVILNQFKDSYALVGYECVYDALPHMVTVNQELPAGATIVYPYGNVFTNAGSYEVVGVMSKNGYESKTLTTTLTIHQAERDASGIAFENSTVVYNGEMRTIEAAGVPEGVEATYDIFDFDHSIRINKAVNAGKYRIVAHFVDSSPNYVKIPDKEAVLTIEKADYDLTGIGLADVVREFDGQEYQAKLIGESNLPTGIKVKYSYLDAEGKAVSSNAKVGDYTIVASFEGGDMANYNPIEPITASLKVRPRIIRIADKISFESKTVNFDEDQVHSIHITGDLPDTVEVSYLNNDQTYGGEYEVKALFKAKNENEVVDVEEMTAYLIINKVRRAVMVYNEESKDYDLPFSGSNLAIENNVIKVSGYDDKTFTCVSADLYRMIDDEKISNNFVVNPNMLVSGTTYKYIVRFEYLDERMNDSVILSEESDNFTYYAGA